MIKNLFLDSRNGGNFFQIIALKRRIFVYCSRKKGFLVLGVAVGGCLFPET